MTTWQWNDNTDILWNDSHAILLNVVTGGGGGGRGITRQEIITKQKPIEEILLEKEELTLPIRLTANQSEKIKLFPSIALFSKEMIKLPYQIVSSINDFSVLFLPVTKHW